MKLVFQCNLDEIRDAGDLYSLNNRMRSDHEDFGICHPVPRVGESLRFPFWKNASRGFEEPFFYTLRVVAVDYNYADNEAIIELHTPSVQAAYMTITEWSEWFKKHRFDR